MNESTNIDLKNAIAFVIRRVEGQALRSGEPLDDNERFMLSNLPTTPYFRHSIDPHALVPRDARYEKLCRVTKAALISDLNTHSEANIDWQFASAVLRLNRHPMSRLLQWAGLKDRRPWWDQWLLLITAIFLVACGVLAISSFDANKPAERAAWAALICVYALVIAVLHFGLRQLDRWQLKRTIKTGRTASGASLSQDS
jgi:hypothetical protein